MRKFFLKNKIKIARFFIVVLSINIFFAGTFVWLDIGRTGLSWFNLIAGMFLLSSCIQDIRNKKEY